MASRDCYTAIGFVSSAARVPWTDTQESRRVSDWLPRIDEVFLDSTTGRMNTRWYNYFRALGERLGGIDGPSLGTVNTSITDTQSMVLETSNYAARIVDYATSISSAADATANVVKRNNLPGAASIPVIVSPPTKPNSNSG